jgi:hypothetical protein
LSKREVVEREHVAQSKAGSLKNVNDFLGRSNVVKSAAFIMIVQAAHGYELFFFSWIEGKKRIYSFSVEFIGKSIEADGNNEV